MTDAFILFDNGPDGGQQAFAAPRDVIVANSANEVPGAMDALRAAQDAGLWLAGFASYELGYVLEPRLATLLPEGRRVPLICFGVFDGPDKAAAHSLAYQGLAERDAAQLSAPVPCWSEADYSAAFEQVKDYICAGDFYQANLTFPMRARLRGSALGLYAALQRVQPVKYGSVVDLGQGSVFVSRSPELFFRVDRHGLIQTRPMKGTVPRGADAAEDAELIRFLANDPKNRAENLMIVDLLRNDISKVSEVGSVQVPELFTVEEYATVYQMTSLVQAQLRAGTGLPDLLQGLFPCGSITGAPKVRAMEVLRALEPAPRDIYCGSIGWLAPDGRAEFNVAIRTLTLFDGEGEGEGDGCDVVLNVGGGVVYDSTARSEYEEALWKARYTKLLPPIFS